MSREKEKGRDGEEVVALSRGLDVLRRIAAADAPVSNRELAEWTGIPKPTISRLTATLVSANLLFQLPDSERFVLTASVLELSNGFLRNFDIRARARPFLIELADRTTLSVHLAVRDRLDMVVIDTIRPRSAVLVSRLEVGSRIADAGFRAVPPGPPAAPRPASLTLVPRPGDPDTGRGTGHLRALTAGADRGR